jgi:hypothetical protein
MKKFPEKFLIFILSLFFVGTGMAMNIIPLFTMPQDRIYNGLQGYVDDYTGYVSYVKEGMYGLNTFRVRSLPPPQPDTSAQIIYIVMGKLGNFFHWDAPLSYHVSRAILGFWLFFAVYKLFKLIVPGKINYMLVLIIAAFSGSLGWYTNSGGQWFYHTLTQFGFTDNIALKFASRPHYMAAAALFIVISTIHLKSTKTKLPILLIVLLMAFVMATMHPVFAILMGTISGIMILYRLIKYRNLKYIVGTYLFCGLGLILGIAVSYIGTHQYPYTWILAFEEYVRNEKLPFLAIYSDLISFGPTLWVGMIGLVFVLIKNRFKREADVYLIVWLIVQLAFFFYFYKFFRTERVRYIQSLYFIPMAYGTIQIFMAISQKIGKWFLPIATIIIIGTMASTFVYGFFQSIYYHFDYRTYSLFIFPTQNIMKAYQWVDQNTPEGSMIIAGYDAATNMLMYTHNYILGNNEGWPAGLKERMEQGRDNFYAGAWTKSETQNYLTTNNIKYVYKGYQEPDGFLKYPFYKPVYTNPEVTIYQVEL